MIIIEISLDERQSNAIFLTISGHCATTEKEIVKCRRCRDKDKALKKRKRKRDESSSWSDLDEANNNKLIQMFSDGDEMIDDNGEIKIRIRVGCCVGVSKQHHENHVVLDRIKRDVHKSCPGLMLTISAHLSNKEVLLCKSPTPIRVLGKAMHDPDKKTHPDFKTHSADSTSEDIEDVGQILQSRRNFFGCSSCSSRGDGEYFATNFSKVKPSMLLQLFSNTIGKLVGDAKKAPVVDLKLNRPFEKYTTEYSKLFRVYTVFAVGACVYGYLDTARRFWERSLALSEKFDHFVDIEKKNLISIADGFNRISLYFSSGGEYKNGAYYSNKAFVMLESLLDVDLDTVDSHVYETALWSQSTYNLDYITLTCAKHWALKRDKCEILSYVLFLQIITCVSPSIAMYVKSKVGDTKPLDSRLCLDISKGLLDELKSIFEQNKYFNQRYSKLIREGFESFERWLQGDTEYALELAKNASIQSSLVESPQFPALIPTYFACLVCYMSMEKGNPDAVGLVDYAELCIKSFTRIAHFRWVRLLIEFFIDGIKRITGRAIELNTCPLRDNSSEY